MILLKFQRWGGDKPTRYATLLRIKIVTVGEFEYWISKYFILCKIQSLQELVKLRNTRCTWQEQSENWKESIVWNLKHALSQPFCYLFVRSWFSMNFHFAKPTTTTILNKRKSSLQKVVACGHVMFLVRSSLHCC